MYTIFILSAKEGAWLFERRYSQLRSTVETLKKTNPALEFPPFPSKKYFRHRTPDFIERRRGEIETWLRAAFEACAKSTTPSVIAFFKPRDKIVVENAGPEPTVDASN
jgi:hypothetical protein